MKKSIFSRIGVTLLAALMLFGMVACGGSAGGGTPAPSTPSPSTPAPSTPSPSTPAPSENLPTYKITYASNDAPGALRYDLMELPFAQLMEEKTNGRITVEIYPSGSLSKPGSLLSAIENGAVDSGQDSYTRYTGQFPYYELFCMPGWLFNTFEEFTAVANDYVKEFPDATMENYKPIVICDAGQFGLVAVKPIRTIADVKGKSIRNTSQFIPLFDKLGAVSVDIASGDMYEALRLNTIEAVTTNNHAIPNFHLEEVCNSFTALPIVHTDVAIFMSQALYDEFDAELQAQVDEVCAEMLPIALDYIHAATDDAIDSTMAANPNFEFLTFSAEDVATLAETAKSLLTQRAADMDAAGLKGTEAFNWLDARQSK